MSSTRVAGADQPFRQERFASSTGERRGLLANLVSRRVQTLPNAEDRELIWWLQEASLRDMEGAHFACTSFPAWPENLRHPAQSPLERIAAKLFTDSLVFIRTKGGGKNATPRHLADFLARYCLDPESKLEHFQGFRDLRSALLACKTEMQSANNAAVAKTSVNVAVREALDFCLSQKGLCLMEGTYRSGKSFSAQSWCLERPGRARYLSLSAYTDETTFFRLIARSIGTASTAQRKALEIRQRVEDGLRTRDLMLVIDECEYLLPACARPTTAPSRLNYLMADLENRGVAVALIGSRNFSRTLTNLERKLPTYGAEQFYGRLRLRPQLPDELTEEDLFAVASLALPKSDQPSRMLLVGHALTAKGRIASLEHATKRALFFAEIERRPVRFSDVERAINESSPDMAIFQNRTSASSPPPARSNNARGIRKAAASSPRAFRGTTFRQPGREVLRIT